MRTFPVLTLAASLILAATAAHAGDPTLIEGKAQWKSTSCTEPAMPPSLLAANKESPASDMNKLMENYNTYSAAMQAYMDCVHKEAETDITTTTQTISESAQAIINNAQKKVTDLHNTMKTKK